MNEVGQLLRAEFLKIRTTRTMLGLVAGTVGFVALIAIVVAASGDASKLDGSDGTRKILAIASSGAVFALCLGIIGMAGEYRHGTMGHAMIAAPQRWQIVLAKLIAYLAAGAVLGLVSFAVVLGVGEIVAAVRGSSVGLSGSLPLKILVGSMLGHALYAAIGVGLGALLKDQVAALLVGVGWTLLLESFLDAASKDVSKFLPGGALSALVRSSTDGVLSQPAGALVLLGYAALIGAAGTMIARGRDLT